MGAEAPSSAVILAAGRARRLAPLTDAVPKCLLPVGGTPLLVRMLRALEHAGIVETVIVVGHLAGRIRTAVRHRRGGAMTVRSVDNPDYAKGSALSLYAAREFLRRPTLVLDADVLFADAVLERLLGCPHANALLVDRGFRDTGEEVKVYSAGDRVVAVSKARIPNEWDTVGEGVGFYKLDATGGGALLDVLEPLVVESGGLAEYEDAVDAWVDRCRVGSAEVTDLPWTEIDFREDLERAEVDVLPRIEALQAEAPELEDGLVVRIHLDAQPRARRVCRHVLDVLEIHGVAPAAVLRGAVGPGPRRRRRRLPVLATATGEPYVVDALVTRSELARLLPDLQRVVLRAGGAIALHEARMVGHGRRHRP